MSIQQHHEVTVTETAAQVCGVKGKKMGRKSRLKRSLTSFRPGQVSQEFNEDRTLTLTIPASSSIGTDDEAEKVRQLAKQLTDFTQIGTITKYGVTEGAWEVGFALKGAAQSDDDALLSDAFRQLHAVIEGSAVLQQGFVPVKPTWKFMVGDFVADEGGFV